MSSENDDEISVSISKRRSTVNFVDTALAYIFMLIFWRSHLLLDLAYAYVSACAYALVKTSLNSSRFSRKFDSSEISLVVLA